MQNKRSLTSETELVSGLKMLAQAYEEISVIKMQRVRDYVLKNRDFLTGVSYVFYDVKTSYRQQIEELMKLKKITNIASFSTINKNGKMVSVFLSANNKLYGDIILKVFYLFMENIKKSDSDIVVVGKLGRELYNQWNIKKPYKYFEIPDSDLKIEDLKEIISYIINYEKVDVFYGRFANIVNQVSTFSNISGEQTFDTEVKPNPNSKFIFEPSLEKILNFFETQIFASFFKQTVHEFHLARLASRIKAMEEALSNIDKRINELKGQTRRVKRLSDNKKQIETIAGISLWSQG